MTIEDIEQVRAIDQISFSLPWPENAYRFELTQNPASMCMVAQLVESSMANKIVAMIVIWLIQDEAHIATIAVHPDFRVRGIGKRLLACALEKAVERGAKRAMLEVRANNLVAQSLYYRFGFEVVNRRPRYYRDNAEDALLMNLTNLNEKLAEWRSVQSEDVLEENKIICLE